MHKSKFVNVMICRVSENINCSCEFIIKVVLKVKCVLLKCAEIITAFTAALV